MSKHTPGPWYVAKTGNDQGLIISEQTGSNVAVSYDAKDAPLIAAAPDLLAALRDMVHFDDLPKDEQQPAVEKARAAIAKAEGRS